MFGYLPHKAAAATAQVQRILARQGKPTSLLEARGGRMRSGPAKTTILHHVARDVLGAWLRSQNQPRGTCVSRGVKRIQDLTQCILIKAGYNLAFKYVSHAFIYGACRTHGGALGGNPNDENDDGAVGAWAAWSAANDGNLTNEECGDDDNDDRLACQWGARGVPQQYRPIAKDNITKQVILAQSFDDVRDAILDLRGVSVASTIGFMGNGSFRRDKDGVCRAGGTWPHQMAYTGYCPDLAGRGEALLIDQSWGNAPGGPMGPLEIPDYSFWALRSDCERMIRQKDTWIFNGLNGWESNDLSFIV